MKHELELPDSIYNREPQTWDRFYETLQEMLNRMAMSYFKYHADMPIHEDQEYEDYMAFVRQRMAMYDGGGKKEVLCDSDCGRKHSLSCFITRAVLDTGNTENLLDAANGLILERLHPHHPKAHFRSQSSDESTGRVIK